MFPIVRDQLEEEEGESSVLHYSGAPVVTPLLRQDDDDIQVGFFFSFSFILQLEVCQSWP